MANFPSRALRLLKPAVFVLIATLLWNTLAASPASSQTSQSQARKLKVSVPPEYPELARKMNIQGVARVLLTVTADGRVVGVKELGGNPVLVAALSKRSVSGNMNQPTARVRLKCGLSSCKITILSARPP